jgi:hypothetical protein
MSQAVCALMSTRAHQLRCRRRRRKQRVDCPEISGDLLPPSPPAEKATARENQGHRSSLRRIEAHERLVSSELVSPYRSRSAFASSERPSASSASAVTRALHDRSSPQSGSSSAFLLCRRSATSRHMQCSKTGPFDHVVSTAERTPTLSFSIVLPTDRKVIDRLLAPIAAVLRLDSCSSVNAVPRW